MDSEDIIEGIVLMNKNLSDFELLELIKKDSYIKKCYLEDDEILESIRSTRLIYKI